jgi:hypothetical protein
MTETTTPPPSKELVVTPPKFDAHDRCDKCDAQAYYRARLRTGTLQFCRHHNTEYGPALAALGAKIEEYTEGLKVLGAPMDVSPNA